MIAAKINDDGNPELLKLNEKRKNQLTLAFTAAAAIVGLFVGLEPPPEDLTTNFAIRGFLSAGFAFAVYYPTRWLCPPNIRKAGYTTADIDLDIATGPELREFFGARDLFEVKAAISKYTVSNGIGRQVVRLPTPESIKSSHDGFTGWIELPTSQGKYVHFPI